MGIQHPLHGFSPRLTDLPGAAVQLGPLQAVREGFKRKGCESNRENLPCDEHGLRESSVAVVGWGYLVALLLTARTKWGK